MRTVVFVRIALGSSVAAALLVSCAGSQSAFGPTAGLKGVPNWVSGNLARNYSVLFSFDNSDGASPRSDLLDVNGTLYGTTWTGGGGANCPDSDGCGTVFSVTKAGKQTVLYEFLGGEDGAAPNGDLINVNGVLYGTTQWGGFCKASSSGCGTVFSITTAGTHKVLYRFAGKRDGDGPSGRLLNMNGTLYGTTVAGGRWRSGGTVFSVTTAGKERVIAILDRKNGIAPSPLVNVNGTLYGTEYDLGPNGNGTVFSVTLAGKVSVLHSFTGPPDGAFPIGGLLDVNGTLYGTTSSGGASGCRSSGYNCGTVFSITTAGNERVLYRFGSSPNDGGDPNARLLGVAGMLYGTTISGGTYGGGTVFSVTTAGKETVLHSFGAPHANDGYAPLASVTNAKSMLYGTTTSGGGKQNSGVVFSLKF